MKLLICYFFIISIFSNSLFAQDYELGKVTKTQLEEKFHPTDSSAVAAFLFKKAITKFKYDITNGFVSKTEFTIKLKIYKKEGLKWANFEIPYYVGYKTLDNDVITISKAFTYNIENGKVEKEKVSSEGKFKEKINELWETKIITFPNVKVGSIIEFKYEVKTENLSELPNFQFQYKIPLNHGQFITEIPIFYIYKSIKIGYVDVDMTDVIEETSQSFEGKYNNSNNLSYKQIKTIFNVKDVPAILEESYVNNVKNYYGNIEHELQTIQFPDEKSKQIATTWEDVAKSIYAEKDFGDELKKNNYFLTDLKLLINKTEDKQERLKIVFDYVKNKMNWNGKYGYNTKKGVELAYKENSGNIAEINLILTSMLQMAGLEAFPVVLSTIDNGLALFPNRSKLNCVIASVKLDGKNILLDASSKYSTSKNLPTRDLNYKGRQINNDGTNTEIDLMPTYNSVELSNLMVSVNSDATLTGKFKKQYNDYNAIKFRENYGVVGVESYVEIIENKYKNIQIDSYQIKNKDSINEPIIESYSVKDNNTIEKIGDKIFFPSMLHLALKRNMFKEENRKYPVDFNFPIKEKFNIIITIPDNYVLESLPKSISIAMDNKLGYFTFATSNTNNQIIISVSLDINTTIFYPDDYQTLKEFYKVMIEKQNEKVVLKKI